MRQRSVDITDKDTIEITETGSHGNGFLSKFKRNIRSHAIPVIVLGIITALTVQGFFQHKAEEKSNKVVKTAVENYVPAANGNFSIVGRAYGHGHGMSQYGARGAALRGVSANNILNFYYPNTTSTNMGNPNIRIRMAASEPGPLTVAGQAGLYAVGGNGSRVNLGTSSPRWRAQWAGTKFNIQKVVNNRWYNVAALPNPVTFAGVSRMAVFYAVQKNICKRNFSVILPGIAKAVVSGSKIYALAVTPMESYLRGVVASEMPSHWPANALQAQTVAARSYAASKMKASRAYDVLDTTADQCWDGEASYQPTTDKAIAATKNTVRTYRGVPIFAQFSSSHGGWLLAGSKPYLVTKPDVYEQYAGLRDWTATFNVSRLAGIDGSGGVTVATGLQILQRDGRGGWGGRILSARIIGRNAQGQSASFTITGDKLRSSLGLKSTMFGFTSASRVISSNSGAARPSTAPATVAKSQSGAKVKAPSAVKVSGRLVGKKIYVTWKAPAKVKVYGYIIQTEKTKHVFKLSSRAKKATFKREPRHVKQRYYVRVYSSAGYSNWVATAPLALP